MKHRRQPRLLSILLISALALACRDKSDKSDKSDKKPTDLPAEDDGQESGAGSSSPADSFGMMSALLAGQVDKPGPYESPRESPAFDADGPHLAVLELSGSISERRGFSFTQGFEGTELRPLIDKLGDLLGDSNVTGLVIRWGDLAIEPALAEELHGELRALRQRHADKPIACHAEAVSTYTYWVMTACTTIALAPGGELSIPGVAAVPLHLKGLLDRLGIEADFLHIGDYKGAAEPLTLDAPSAQSRETTSMILDQAFAGLIEAIKGRGLEEPVVRELIDRAMIKAKDAVDAKLVDHVMPFAEFRDVLGGEWRRAKLGSPSNPTQKLFELLGVTPPKRPRGKRIALVYAVGNVVDGSGSIGGANEEIASRTLVAALEALGREDDVKAVVLRISSPGGSALASEVIWGAIGELRARKPIVVSMGAVAASGGYYIAAPATRIFALGNTLTGSIGVVGGKLATAGGLDKIGIKAYPTGRGKHALLFASPEPWSKEQREVVRASMRAVYDQFAGRVRQGRGDIDDALMQGRVWTGAKALEHKLVDEIGGLNAAVAYAREKAKLGDDSPIEVYPPEPTLRDMLGSLGVSSRLSMLAELGLEPRVANVIDTVVGLVSGFSAQPVQAALIWPVVLR